MKLNVFQTMIFVVVSVTCNEHQRANELVRTVKHVVQAGLRGSGYLTVDARSHAISLVKQGLERMDTEHVYPLIKVPVLQLAVDLLTSNVEAKETPASTADDESSIHILHIPKNAG